MHWDEEFFVLDKKERKTGKSFIENESLSLNTEDDIPLKARRTSVWVDEDPKNVKEKLHKDIKEESDDEIPIIPDIDELEDDSLNLPDVKKMISVDQSTYKELDNQFDNLKGDHVNFGNLGDIDLSFLTNKLYPESEVQLCTDVWTVESLYMELSKNCT